MKQDLHDAVKKLHGHTDIHLNVKMPAMSILFPEQDIPPPSLVNALSLLANQVVADDSRYNDHAAGYLHHSFMVDFCPEGAKGQRILYRVQPLVRGESYAMRRSNLSVLDYRTDIRPPNAVDAILMKADWQRVGGLVIISGSTGSGKTTLSYSTIIERLKRFGGYCLAIEDPTEVPGAYGVHSRGGKRGFLAQIDASVRGGYENAIMDGLRSIPITENRPIVFIGEIRDGKTAAEVLRFSISGNLVFVTVHAEDHSAACQRIVSLAQNGGEPDARNLLSKSLVASINLRMTPERTVQYSTLDINQKIRQSVMANNYAEFNSELKQQQQIAPIIMGSTLPKRHVIPEL